MFQHPWVLSFLFCVLALLFFRNRRYYLRQATTQHLRDTVSLHKGRMTLVSFLPSFLCTVAMTLVIVAAADWVVGKKIVYKKRLIHRYVLIDDASSSMTQGDIEVDKTGLITQLSKPLESMTFGNKTFLSLLEHSSQDAHATRDYVGLVVFSNDAFVVSYPTTDYATLRVKLDMIQWHMPPLSQGTEVSRGLWAGIRVINTQLTQAHIPSYSQKELFDLETSLLGSESDFSLPPSLEKRTESLKKSYMGTSLIVFTDGFFSLDGSNILFSGNKILSLCQLLGIRAYLISNVTLDPHHALTFKQTGGNALFISELSRESLSKAYATIAQSQAQEQILEDGVELESRYLYCAVPGIVLLFVWLLVKNTISRSLTSAP